MKCPNCQFENQEGSKFCGGCGEQFDHTCPECGANNPVENKFCNECGSDLKPVKEVSDQITETISPPVSPSKDITGADTSAVKCERKHVTVLFSDLSGYTAITERLDPEDVKEIMSKIFAEIVQIVKKYEGFVERFVGDAVMALFGVPIAHEDDAVRAIKVAREIHDTIEYISPQFEKRVGQKLTMHTGINTGLVVTGEVNLEKGTHGVTGDAVNLAARLNSIASAGEILVGPETFLQAEGFYTFEILKPTRVKGKTDPVQVYNVLSTKKKPVKIHRLSGRKAVLIGRKKELAQLHKALEQLRKGEGTVFSICGEAGTGKSRLIEEFRANLDINEFLWAEGHAYSYSKNITYFPLINLFNQAWQIEEGDLPEKVKSKIEINVQRLIGEGKGIKSYLGSLYALNYPEIKNVDPELWKFRLKEAVKAVLTALTKKAPTVICLEDLHWADPSSIDLLRSLILEIRAPALFLCVYRPPFTLFTSHQSRSLGNNYQEIRLQEFSIAEAREMIISLLKTKHLPQGLLQFIREKVEGNPFYLEEVINGLIDSGTLIPENRSWYLAKPLVESDIPPTVLGVISARLDRLEEELKCILQEASVIGRAFLYDILRRITQLEGQIDNYLNDLEHLDLVRRRSLGQDLEYIFKHALTQEAVYNSLLKKQRQEIHKRIALVIEKLFKERLSEFYETLAYHFEKSGSVQTAIYYLMKSGDKSLNRYSVEEAHQYFKQAFDLISHKSNIKEKEKGLLIDILIKWAFVFHYRGDFKGLKEILTTYKDLVTELGDRKRLGMYYTLLGLALYETGTVQNSYQCLCKALKIGEEIKNPRITGYACSWLSWVCPELGRIHEGIQYGRKAQEIYHTHDPEDYLFFNTLAGMGLAYWYMGDRVKTFESGKALLDFGQKKGNTRSVVLGHFVTGCSYLVDGNLPSATRCFQKAIEVSSDPWYCQFPKMLLGFSYVSEGRLKEAQDSIDEVLRYSHQFGTEIIKTPAYSIMGMIATAKGSLAKGIRMIEDAQKENLKSGRRYSYTILEYVLGKIYLEISTKARLSFTALKNMRFLIINAPFAARKAEKHLHKSIEVAKEIGAKNILAQAYLDLGVFFGAKGRVRDSRECVQHAIQLFEYCGAEVYLKMANETLASLQ